MEGNMLMVFLFASAIGLALSNPLVRPNYDNIPKCMQPPASGLCLAYIPSFYYNPSTEKCESFIYGGCQGNANRFFNEQECLAQCAGFKQETNEFKLVLENDEEQAASKEEVQQVEENICVQPAVMGPCRAMLPRFYFNGDKCETFIYGGCDGNENNFQTVEACQQRCENKSSEEVGTSSEDVSAENSQESEEKSENESKEEPTSNESA